MAKENGLAVFSLRLPSELAKQVDDRASVNRRTRNAELTVLIEKGIEASVQADLELLKKHGDKLGLTPTPE